MEEIATLIIRVQSDQADAAKKRLSELGFAAGKAETATSGLANAWRGMTALLGSLVGVSAAIAGLNKLVTVATQFESLEAQLKTATGSAENARVAFAALQDFATKTPYDLAQTVDAFIKLTNLGLTPSERALLSYGNTASALGSTLEEMVLAVSNATVGQYINLRKFGIQARTDADGVVFTFQGVSTKVKQNAKDVEDYFIKLGESKFSGAMIDRMVTLEGKISNLGDAWDVLFATISKAGAGELMKQGIDLAISTIQELTDQIASGQLVAEISAIGGKFRGWADDVSATVKIINAELAQIQAPESAADWLKSALVNAPENVRAFIGIISTTLATLIQAGDLAASALAQYFHGAFELMASDASSASKEIKRLMNPFDRSESTFFDELTKSGSKFTASNVENLARTKRNFSDLKETFVSSIDSILDTQAKAVAGSKAEFDASKKLREEYDAQGKGAILLQKIREEIFGSADRLERFGNGSKAPTEQFDQLVLGLRSQEKALQESYRKRQDLIRDNTEKGSKLQADLFAELDNKYSQERQTLISQHLGEELDVMTTALEDGARAERAILERGYVEKQNHLLDALENELITEAEYAERLKQAKVQHGRELIEIDRKLEDDKQRQRQNLGPDLSYQGNETLDQIALEIRALNEGHAQKQKDLERALDDKVITEEEYFRRMLALEARYAADSNKLQLEKQRFQLNTAADFFSNLATIASVFGKKGAKIAKAAAIVNATIKTYESATSAYASLAGIPYVGPALGAVAAAAAIAAGMVNVAKIKSQDFAGAYAGGGMIPAGKYGITQEAGFEITHGPAVVTSARATADSMGEGSGTNVTVNVINNAGVEVQTRERDDANGKIVDVVITRATKEIAGDIRSGSGPVSAALRETFGLRRGVA